MQRTIFYRLVAILLMLFTLLCLFGCDRNPPETTGNLLETTASDPTDTEADTSSDVTETDEETAEEFFFSQSDPISEYVLVYGDECGRDAAEMLAGAIADAFAVQLPVVSDKENKTEREILVGVTARTEGVKSLSELDPFKYLVKTVDKKLLIGGLSEYSVKNGVTSFIRDYVKGDTDGGLLLLPKTYEKMAHCYISNDPSELSREADVRVLFYNTVIDPATIDASDHCPIYIDANLSDAVTSTS